MNYPKDKVVVGTVKWYPIDGSMPKAMPVSKFWGDADIPTKEQIVEYLKKFGHDVAPLSVAYSPRHSRPAPKQRKPSI